MEENKNNKDTKFYRQFARYSALGLEMGLSVAIGLAIGYFLDRYFHTKPWLTIIFLILGVAAAFRSLASLAKEIDKREQKK
jgi:ATP synthase protein I